jgi:hypothetical protein
VENGFAEVLDVVPGKVARIERVTVQHHNFHARENSGRGGHRNICGS